MYVKEKDRKYLKKGGARKVSEVNLGSGDDDGEEEEQNITETGARRKFKAKHTITGPE